MFIHCHHHHDPQYLFQSKDSYTLANETLRIASGHSLEAQGHELFTGKCKQTEALYLAETGKIDTTLAAISKILIHIYSLLASK